MYFLIDFENVKNAGMCGTEHLLPDDHVILFYSESTPVMEQRHLWNIQNSGCGFDICKLVTRRRNGLDFYIATKVGELFGSNRCNKAVLVSCDGGFQAIRDYWQECSGTKNRVAISNCIEQGIISAGENSERANLIRSYRKTVDIGNFHAAYQESVKLQKALRDTFSGTAFAPYLKEIEEIIKAGVSPKVIYLDSLRRFGRKEGLEVYRMLKACEGLPTRPFASSARA